MIRKVFQAFTILLFIFQFQQSVRKYFRYPVVEHKSRVSVRELPSPVVYVCHVGQFNYAKAKNNGYRSFTHFMAGIKSNRSDVIWQGYDRNQTYKHLENMLLDSDYSSLHAYSFSYYRPTNLWIDIEWKRTFLFPNGVCVELENLLKQNYFSIYSKKEVSIFFVDPARANNIRTEETLDATLSIGPTTSVYFTHGKYKLEYSLNDDSIHDGTTCTDYTKAEVSYGDCLNDIMTQEFLATYGCLPPWMFTNKTHMICKKETNINANTLEMSPIFDDFVSLVYNDETEMFKRCLPPCKTMQLKLKQSFFTKKFNKEARFVANSEEWATVHTKVYSYDILSLTVDLGSALGLWLGLSCLSILDNILENCIFMKKYLKK